MIAKTDRAYYWIDDEEIKKTKSDYYIKTVDEYNDIHTAIKNDKNWFDRVIKLCSHYYDKNVTGGSLHIVLDDGNLDDINVSWCAGLALGNQDHEGIDLADLILGMTYKQRKKLYMAYPQYKQT